MLFSPLVRSVRHQVQAPQTSASSPEPAVAESAPAGAAEAEMQLPVEKIKLIHV